MTEILNLILIPKYLILKPHIGPHYLASAKAAASCFATHRHSGSSFQTFSFLINHKPVVTHLVWSQLGLGAAAQCRGRPSTAGGHQSAFHCICSVWNSFLVRKHFLNKPWCSDELSQRKKWKPQSALQTKADFILFIYWEESKNKRLLNDKELFSTLAEASFIHIRKCLNLTETWNSSLLMVAWGSPKRGHTLALYCKWAAPLECPPAEYWWWLLWFLTVDMLWVLSRCIMVLAITVTWPTLGIHYHHHSLFFLLSFIPAAESDKREQVLFPPEAFQVQNDQILFRLTSVFTAFKL